MSGDNEDKIDLKSKIYDKLIEIAKKVDVPLNKVVDASFLYGYGRFWYPLQKYYSGLEVEDQPVKEEDYEPLLSVLKEQIEVSYEIVQKIDQFEAKFEERHSFGTFQDFDDRHHEFVKYLEESNKPTEKTIEAPAKKSMISKVVEKSPEEEPSPPEPTIQVDKPDTFFKICVAYLTPQIHGIFDIFELLIFFLLAALVNFYIFWGLNSIWPIFNFEHSLRFYPFFIPFQILLIIGTILLSSFVIGKVWYYITNSLGKLVKKNKVNK